MKIVRVSYTTSADFAQRNSHNIQKVMSSLRELKSSGVRYNVTLGEDGKTFTHTAFFKSEADEKILTELPEFLDFQNQLQASGLESPSKQDQPTLVGASFDVFGS